MDMLEVLAQIRELLRQKGRITYRLLKMQFQLDDEQLDVLKEELIDAERVAEGEESKVLVWRGEEGAGESERRRNGEPKTSPQPLTPKLQLPSAYTPQHLAERIRAEQAAMEARGSANGERKTITALFADLKGSTVLIEGLDPEEARAIIDPALQLMMDAVHQYEGFVAQALGDGVFALFGAPIAHEDHPQRALYAALRMQESMRRYGDTLRQKGYSPLLMRVGLNTGEVVLRSIRKDDLRADYVPVGHSTNLAARMEQLATPGSIVVSAYTHRLTDGYFSFKDLGATQIKGVEEPLRIYEILGVGQLRTRLQVSASRYGLTRFVGRQGEMEQLNKALEQAKAGQGQVVGAMGEPGLGKSRLFHEFKLLSLGGCLVLEAYSVSHGKATAYLPVIELLKSYFRIEPQDDERMRREKVAGKVVMLDRSLEDTLPYLFALLGIEEQPSLLAQIDPQIRRRRTFEALKKLFLRESLNQPLVLIFEDLHWIDGETQGFLDVLSESVASAKILLLTNYRPEYRHEWGQKTYYTQLRLAPFGRQEAEEFLDVLLGTSVRAGLVPAHTGRPQGSPLQVLKQLILDKTQGTPFFMEEIVQELVEQGVLVRDSVGAGLVPTHSEGAHKGTPLQIPTTVQAVLAARIDRLAPDEKELLQQLAVIGRQFPLSLVKRVVAQPEAELYRVLSSLQAKEFLYEQPAFLESEYLFKHALTQDVAYGTVLQELRKALHERTAQAMEALYVENLEDHYPELAHHYSQSENAQKAVEYLELTGQQAVQQSANTEAIHHLTQAANILQTLPDSSERAQQELKLQLILGPALMTLKGYSAPEVESAYTRARFLCQQVGQPAQLFQVLMGQRSVYLLRGDIRTACEIGEQTLQLAQELQDPALLPWGHLAVANPYLSLGELVLARQHAEQAIALSDPRLSRISLSAVTDIEGASRISAAWVLWMLGYPDQAAGRVSEVVARPAESSNPSMRAWTFAYSAWLHQLRRDVALVCQYAEEGENLSREHNFPFLASVCAILQGWAMAEQGQLEEGVTRLQEGVTAYRTTGAQVWLSLYLAFLGHLYGRLGETRRGLSTLADALDLAHRIQDRSCEAELYRLKGELTLQLGTRDSGLEVGFSSPQAPSLKPQVSGGVAREAEECFRKAIDIAEKQQAKSWELRAATSLARLWQSQGKTSEAHELLAPVYNWFTEGFDTADLQDAKALLAQLPDRL